jgi:hypothetical protein
VRPSDCKVLGKETLHVTVQEINRLLHLNQQKFSINSLWPGRFIEFMHHCDFLDSGEHQKVAFWKAPGNESMSPSTPSNSTRAVS